MSPLPEIEPSRRHVNSADRVNEYRFFNDQISPDEKWVWIIYNKTGQSRQSEFFKMKGVDLGSPLEEYDTKEEVRGRVFHKVFTTSQKGVYLDLKFTDYDLSEKRVNVMLDSCFQAEFHRLGEKADAEYISSIANGELL